MPITNGPPVPERLSDRYVPATLASKRASGLACATQRARSRVEAHPGEVSTNIHEGPLMRFGAHVDLMSRSKLKCAHFLPSRLSVQVHSGTLGAHQARHLPNEGGRVVCHDGPSNRRYRYDSAPFSCARAPASACSMASPETFVLCPRPRESDSVAPPCSRADTRLVGSRSSRCTRAHRKP